MKEPINNIIISYLEQQKLEGKEWVFKNWIQSYVYERSDTHHNWSTTDRELRRMCETGEILKDKKEIVGRKVLVYKLNDQTKETPEAKNPFPIKETCLADFFLVDSHEGREERILPLHNVREINDNQGSSSGTRDWGQTQLFTV